MVFVAFQLTFADHHAGPDHRLDRGPLEVRRVRRVRDDLVDRRLRPGRALGVRRLRLAEPFGHRARRPLLRRGLRRRHGRAHQRRCRRPGDGARARQAHGLAARADARAQHAVRAARRRPAVVRLVRLQRRLRARRPTASPVRRGSTRTPPPRPRCSAGWSRRSCATASRPRSVPRRVRSPVWSRSRRAAGWVSPMGSIFIGFIAGFVCAFAVSLKNKFGFDDSLDVVGVHFVGGWIGTLLRRLLQHAPRRTRSATTASSTAAAGTSAAGTC